jgi:hypothetical protein
VLWTTYELDIKERSNDSNILVGKIYEKIFEKLYKTG